MTPQEIFDKVAVALLAQDEWSLKGDACAYRGTEGRKCAVGLLIPDDVYVPEMDIDLGGTGVHELVLRFDRVLPSYFRNNLNLLNDLQTVHDTGLNWSPGRQRMREKLRGVAHQNGLDPAVALTAPAYGGHKQEAA